MPRNGSGNYTVPIGTLAITNTPIESADYNAFIADLVADLNAVRPIGSGGTGRSGLSNDVQSLLGAANYAAMQTQIGVADNAVTASKIASNAVTTIKIANLSITLDKLAQAIREGLANTGDIKFSASAIAPPGWLWCYGQAISRTTYSALFAAIGTVYGAGNGSTTFNVPDGRGRLAAGKDNMGGTSANRITTAGSGIDGNILGRTGGAQNRTLVEANLPPHTHRYNGEEAVNRDTTTSGSQILVVDGNSQNFGNVNNTIPITTSAAADTPNAISTPIPIIPPTIIYNMLIKT